MANLFRLFKRKHKKKNKVPFFAYNARRKHPSYAFKKTKDDKYYNFLLSTGSEKEKYKQLLTPLRKNPDPDNHDCSYIIRRLYKDDYNVFRFSNKKNWKFSNKDKKQIKILVNKYKKR